jgi:hypothetical protein
MDCYTIQERVLERFERPFSQQEKEQLERHFSECRECAQFAALQSQLDFRLQEEVGRPRLSPGFCPALQRGLHRSGRCRGRPGYRMWPISWAQ